jgi:copper chaperone
MNMQSTLKVSGMTCQHCVETVSKAVDNIEGVQNVEVDLNQKNITVTFDESQAQLENIAAKIVQSGFEVVRN